MNPLAALQSAGAPGSLPKAMPRVLNLPESGGKKHELPLKNLLANIPTKRGSPTNASVPMSQSDFQGHYKRQKLDAENPLQIQKQIVPIEGAVKNVTES
jgi:hypothetical protein